MENDYKKLLIRYLNQMDDLIDELGMEEMEREAQATRYEALFDFINNRL